MKKYFIAFFLATSLFFLLISCKTGTGAADPCFEIDDCELSESEKQLIRKIMNDMCNDKKNNTASLYGDNSKSYFYFHYLDSIRPKKVEPIELRFANKLIKNYDAKRGHIEVSRPDRLRHEQQSVGTGIKARDASSVWVSVDEFAPYFGELIQYQLDNSRKVGMKIVFGSYEWDPRDSEIAGGIRTHGDTLSGRNTVFFVGTYDTERGRSDYNVKRHREMRFQSPGASHEIMLKGFNPIVNHGTLCPDSCTITP